MKTYRYRCPECGRYSDTMKMKYKGHGLDEELLECRCGRLLRWNMMIKEEQE